MFHDGFLTEPFQVRTMARQGCLLSPILFLVVLDWVPRRAYGTGRTGILRINHLKLFRCCSLFRIDFATIQWMFRHKLEDLDFADDLCLLGHKLQHNRRRR